MMDGETGTLRGFDRDALALAPQALNPVVRSGRPVGGRDP